MMGRRAAKAGKAFEEQIARENEFLLAQGAAFVFRVPDPIKVLGRRKGQLYGVQTKPAYTDFAGMLATGQFVGFDAKRTESKTSWAFSNLNDFQRWALTMTAAMGGIAFVYLQRVTDGLQWYDYALPIDEDGVIAGVTDRKSIPWDRAEPYLIPRNKTWFDVVVERRQ